MTIQSSAVQRYPRSRYLARIHRIKGWPYLASWLHRLTGALITLYVIIHVTTLSSLRDPSLFERKMEVFATIFPPILEWLLAIPVIFHSLNGGRLILYEIFGNRRDQKVLRWVLGLSICYLVLLGFFMVSGNQGVSPIFFWSYLFLASFLVAYVALDRMRKSQASLLWKLQRISGAFLLLMIPAHMLFMHLDATTGRNAQIIVERMGNGFIKLVDFLLLIGVLYHAAYGIRGICLDYLSSGRTKTGCTVVIALISLYFAWRGTVMIISV